MWWGILWSAWQGRCYCGRGADRAARCCRSQEFGEGERARWVEGEEEEEGVVVVVGAARYGGWRGRRGRQRQHQWYTSARGGCRRGAGPVTTDARRDTVPP